MCIYIYVLNSCSEPFGTQRPWDGAQSSRRLALAPGCQVGVVSTGVAKALQGVLVFVLSHLLYCRRLDLGWEGNEAHGPVGPVSIGPIQLPSKWWFGGVEVGWFYKNQKWLAPVLAGAQYEGINLGISLGENQQLDDLERSVHFSFPAEHQQVDPFQARNRARVMGCTLDLETEATLRRFLTCTFLAVPRSLVPDALHACNRLPSCTRRLWGP